jgi:integrase/recombinase XerD
MQNVPGVHGMAHTALDVFYEWLVTRSHIQKNPFQIEEIKRPRKTTKIQELIELEVLQTLFDTLRRDDSVMARRDYALILLLFDTGLRRTEAASINISDVKFDRGNIIVRKAKRDNDRIVPFNEPLQKVLQNWLDVHPNKNSDNLFVTLRGEFKGLSPRRVNGILVRWLRIAELKNGEQVTPHGLRRAFATYFSDSGGDMFILKDILGHSKIETTKAYVINTGKRLKQQHQKYSPLKLLTLD